MSDERAGTVVTCRHGALARSCDHCAEVAELQAQLTTARTERATLLGLVERWRAREQSVLKLLDHHSLGIADCLHDCANDLDALLQTRTWTP